MGEPFASFLLGDVNNASISITTPTLATYRSLGLFVQDDFRVSSKLTLNIGLRWDYNPTQTEEHNRLYQLQSNHDRSADRLAGRTYLCRKLLGLQRSRRLRIAAAI